MIYLEVGLTEFKEAFKKAGKEKEFSPKGLEQIYKFIEYYSRYLEDIELDVIDLCADFTEYTPKEFIGEFGHLLDSENFDDESELLEAVVEEVKDQTSVIVVGREESYIVQSY